MYSKAKIKNGMATASKDSTLGKMIHQDTQKSCPSSLPASFDDPQTGNYTSV
jgi:hypothetical protein